MSITIPKNHLGRLMLVQEHRAWKTYLLILAAGGEVKSINKLAQLTDYDQKTLVDIIMDLRELQLVDTDASQQETRVFLV